MKVGTIKNKVLTKLTESFSNGDKKEVKKILKKITNDKDLKEMYLFYEEIENKYIDNTDVAKLYVEELSKMLKDKYKLVESTCKDLSKNLKNVEYTSNELYEALDTLSSEDKLTNISEKIQAKNVVLEHILKEKNLSDESVYTENEKMLTTVLTNNFNFMYENTLDESQKTELKNILSLNRNDLKNNIDTLKSEINESLMVTLNESTDSGVKNKINDVLSEIKEMGYNHFNYYKLQELKKDLI